MMDFIAAYAHKKNKNKINRAMFERVYDRPLVEFIVDTCKNLEVIPAIKLESWYLETDQTEIRPRIYKQNSKDPRIKNNRALERLVQPNKTLFDMLYLNFRVTAKGRSVQVQRKVRVLKPLPGGTYLRNGREVRVLNQVVDNSTFVKGNVLNFKTKLYAIKLFTIRSKLKFLDGETATCACFRLDLLSKVTNPLIYYLAQYGLAHTIEMFSMEEFISVVDAPLDEDNYMYLPVNEHLYLEVHAKAFYSHEFVAAFTATLYDILKAEKTVTLKDVYNRTYWLERLSEIFSKKRYVNKALRILISYNKITDIGVKKQLVIAKRRKRNTFTIILWMMTNYGALLKKDSHDLRYKRVRGNEVLAYYFDKHITKNVYSLLNTDNPPFEKYLRLLNSINEFTLLKGAHGGGKGSSTSMFRYERYNDLDAIEISRYTLKGPTGLNGGKKGISMKYRDIYPSHYGRYDLNVCSSNDPGLTGYLCANIKLDETGYFDPEDSEPDNFDEEIEKIVKKYADPKYYKSRREYIETQLSRDEDGFIVLKRIPTSEEMRIAIMENPEAHGCYELEDGLHLIPKHHNVDAKGFKVLTRKRVPDKEPDELLDAEGFHILRRVTTKLATKSRKRK